ncbi:uncharacterized protein LOC124367914 isoform X1 [Homalodisca vitripennis]|uniref:uncharacterized protein LOC124367914 isoform X1 n=2 Tax=Homalodisca vitripennis TaxID=197043 RepID=UPI001EECBFA2|nr:uncharacterized protein LOC124367914 isoform X1 [Homalodisca vitripennis]
MAAEVSADLNVINDEDVLRRMWQQTDDFGRKKEIRQRMYKLREQRLRDFYTDSDTSVTMASRKHAAPTHADSISDQGFMSLKSKEIRDSESPTRDIHRRQGDNNYWNTVQQSSYSTQGGEGDRREVYERSSTGTGYSEDGATQIKLEADERGFTSSQTTEVEGGQCNTNREQHDAQIATASHTKTDGGEAYSYSTSKEHQESKSSVTESKEGSSTFKSSRWETSSSTSSSSRQVVSSSNFGRITSDVDMRAITSGDDVDFTNTSFQDNANTSTIRRVKNVSDSKYKTDANEVRYTTDNREDSTSFIDKEIRNNLRNVQDNSFDVREDYFGDHDSRRDSTSTYTSEVISNVDDYVTNDVSRRVNQEVKIEDRSNVVDQKIMSEINKLDSFLSTQNTGTNTPASPRSVMGDVNWTVVSNNDGEFVYRDDKTPSSPGSRAAPIKYPDNLDLPKECTEGQYVTTYNEHYTKKISVDVSPTHDKFARSLRQTPPGTPRSLSRQSLDRSSPERKAKNSPRSSPDKERRTSVGSNSVDKSSNVRRKTSEVARQTGTSKESTIKNKRKFSTTQTKAAAKARASTPGTSPTTSPTRKQKERSDSPSSASDSDASQVTYEKKTSTTYKRADVVRRNLMDSFDKDTTPTDTENTETSYRPSSPEKSPTRKTSTPTGILRKGLKD